ncbi:TPA: hypothetical protein MIT52_08335 [Klebsiella quasipneumoniae]|nr:hypothetical protein [Klebsiella quasipneumoniae]
MSISDTQQAAKFAADAAVSAAEAKQYLLSIQQPVIDISESVVDAQNAAAAAEIARDQAQGISEGLVQTIESQLSNQEIQFESQMTTQQSSFESSQSERALSFDEKSNEFESRFSFQLSVQESTFSESQTDKENRFQQFLLSSGYVFLGDYENGPFQFSARNQIISYKNEFWRLNAATNPPYTTTGMNSTSWAVDVTHLVSVGDAVLRANLASSENGLGASLIVDKLPYAGAVPRTQHSKNADTLSVKDFGALCDGVTSDSDAVNAAILAAHTIGVGEVHFSGVMAISTPIYARSGVTLVGDGQKTSVIKTLPDFTGNIYETFDFATVQAAQLTNASNGCPSCYGIENCTIDGYNFSGAPTASTGYGVRLYGSQLRLNNLLIGRCANIGLYTELSTVADGSSFNAITDTKFSKIQNIEVLECGYEGFVFFGPTDQYLDNIFVGWPGGSRFDDYDTTGPKTSLLFPGEQIHGVRIMRTAEVGFLHSYDNNYGYAVYISRKAGDPVVRFRANYLMGENGYGNVFIGANVRYAISLLETHNNTRGPTTGGAYSGDAGANPHFYNISTLGGSVSKLDIWRDGDENGSTGVLLKGLSHDINANIYAYSGTFTGGGDGFNNKASTSNLKAHIISKAGVDTLSIGYIEDSTALDNNLDVYASFCDVNISLLGAAGADTGSFYKLKAKSAGTTNISNLARLAGIPYSQAVIMTDDGVYKRRNKALLSLAVDFSVTGLQMLSIPYGNFLVRDPLETEVRLEVSYDAGTLPGVARLAVINIDTVNKEIDFMVEFTGGAAGTGKINAFI